jgi:hypothetical protein
VATGGPSENSSGEGGKRPLLLRPSAWNPTAAAAVVFVVLVVVLAFAALLLIGALTTEKAAPTSSAPPEVVLSPRLKRVSTCLQRAGIAVTNGGLDDFVAENALGGAVKAQLEGSVVTISDGLTPAGATGIVHGYQRLARSLPLAQLLSRQGRFALLWNKPPDPLQTSTIGRCLR